MRTETERFMVIAKSRIHGGTLHTWGPFDSSYAEVLRSTKAHQLRHAVLTIESAPEGRSRIPVGSGNPAPH